MSRLAGPRTPIQTKRFEALLRAGVSQIALLEETNKLREERGLDPVSRETVRRVLMGIFKTEEVIVAFGTLTNTTEKRIEYFPEAPKATAATSE